MTDSRYEVGSAIRFRSSHVMPGEEGPEGVLHEHDYLVDVVVSRAELDEAGTVCDLRVLDDALVRVRGEVEGRDLEIIRPPDRPAVTVEVFAAWAHRFLAERLVGTGVEHLSVRVWESDVAFGGFAGPVPNS